MGKLVYAVVSYALFLASIAWMVVFLADLGVPKTVDLDVRPPAPLPEALAVDVALLALFAVQHSVMARPAFKQRWTRLVPTSIERSTYVLLASCLVLLLLSGCMLRHMFGEGLPPIPPVGSALRRVATAQPTTIKAAPTSVGTVSCSPKISQP